MSKLYFYTPTELDESFLFVMGASVKKVDSPIGFFGTGLKYAIAVTLRIGGNIKIETNKNKYEFYAKPQLLRGEEHKIIYCKKNDVEDLRMPMTTEYGKTWSEWMVMRELWSNTQDENGITWDRESLVETDLHPEWTLITVDCPEVYDAWQTRDKYLLNLARRPLYENSMVQVFQGISNTLFYRGIAVSKSPVNACFTYNFKEMGGHVLTEDRTIDASNLRGFICYAFAQCTNPIVLERYFNAVCTMNSFESTFNINYWPLKKETTEEYAEAAVSAVKTHIIYAPPALKDAVYEYQKEFETEKFYAPVKLTEMQNARYTECINMLQKIGFDFSTYSIYFTDAMPPGHYGSAFMKTNTIVLNYNWTVDHENWKRQTCSTLIEEYIHLTSGARDETRELQEVYNSMIYQIALSGRIA